MTVMAYHCWFSSHSSHYCRLARYWKVGPGEDLLVRQHNATLDIFICYVFLLSKRIQFLYKEFQRGFYSFPKVIPLYCAACNFQVCFHYVPCQDCHYVGQIIRGQQPQHAPQHQFCKNVMTPFCCLDLLGLSTFAFELEMVV